MRLSLPALLVALALALTACSDGGTEDGNDSAVAAPVAAPAGTVTFVGLANLQWAQTEKSATLVDGQLQLTIECDGAVPHNVVFEGEVDDRPLVACQGDDSSTGSVSIPSGTYTYYCSIPGHRTAGMEGTITIT